MSRFLHVRAMACFFCGGTETPAELKDCSLFRKTGSKVGRVARRRQMVRAVRDLHHQRLFHTVVRWMLSYYAHVEVGMQGLACPVRSPHAPLRVLSEHGGARKSIRAASATLPPGGDREIAESVMHGMQPAEPYSWVLRRCETSIARVGRPGASFCTNVASRAIDGWTNN